MSSNEWYIITENHNIYRERLIINKRTFRLVVNSINIPRDKFVLVEAKSTTDFLYKFEASKEEIEIINIFMEEMRLKYEL
jgi:hypothetical protein